MTKEKVGNKSYLALGNMAFRDGRYDEAIHYYKKCAAKYPELENIALKNKELAYSRVKKSAAKIIPAYKPAFPVFYNEDGGSTPIYL
jgi:tetratricopeptide (TPR) repeat protein